MSFAALYAEDGTVERLADREVIAERLARDRGMLWVHVSSATESDAQALGELFGFHPLALHDCLNPAYQRPKVDDFGEYIFLLLHGIDHEATSDLVVTTELNLFVGDRFVVTSSLKTLAAIDEIFERAFQDPRVMERGPALLPHTLIDGLVDSVAPTIERMGEVADAIEDEVLTSPHRDLLPAILRLKRSALQVHRVMQPQREVLLRMARGDYPILPRDVAIYYRDVCDHADRIDDLSAALRERADFATTTYLSAITIRQNETMRVLAIVAAVFLPLALVAGIYGMNFENMPELDWRYGYFAVLAGMAVFAITVVGLLWGRDWVSGGRRRIERNLHFGIEQRLLDEALREAARLRRLVLPPIGR